jgi:signal peptidase II
MNKKRWIRLILDLLAVILLLMVDQATKYWAVLQLKGQAAIILWENVLELQYLENKGAAFGMLQNKKTLFIFMTVVMLIIVFYVLIKLPEQKKFWIWHVFLCCICAGGIGNMIDRVRLDYVIDFIYFKYINFPIFNFADICVTIGTVLLFIVILFGVKEEELQFLKFHIRKDQV